MIDPDWQLIYLTVIVDVITFVICYLLWSVGQTHARLREGADTSAISCAGWLIFV